MRAESTTDHRTDESGRARSTAVWRKIRYENAVWRENPVFLEKCPVKMEKKSVLIASLCCAQSWSQPPSACKASHSSSESPVKINKAPK